MITDYEEELNGPEETHQDQVGRNVVMRGVDYVAAEFACDNPRTENEDTDKDHYVRVRRNVVMRNLEHVAAELACDDHMIEPDHEGEQTEPEEREGHEECLHEGWGTTFLSGAIRHSLVSYLQQSA